MAINKQKIVEEIILIILISMNLLEFAGLLPGEASFVKAIISLTGIGYVIYKASFSDIFFGKKNKHLDIALLVSYFLMISNKFIQFSKSSFEEAKLMQELFVLLIENQVDITVLSFVSGTILLFFISIWVARHFQIQSPSIMHAIHGENIHGFLKKFVTVFFLFLSFFIIFFNPVIEWFALVIDAPLVVLFVFFYIFKIHDIGRRAESEEILFKIAESVDTFLERFINLFHTKKTLFFAISGLLILHLFADVAAFIIPYSLGTDSLYHESLQENHEHLFNLFNLDKTIVPGALNHLSFFFGYIFNVLGILLLMFYPAYIWYVLYAQKMNKNELDPSQKIIINEPGKFLISIFFALMVFQIFVPVFSLTGFSAAEEYDMYGVDIRTRSIISHDLDIGLYITISIFVFFLIMVLSSIDKIRYILFTIMSFSGVLFLGIYIFHYYKSVLLYYWATISLFTTTVSLPNIYFTVINMIFLLIQTLFYIGGYISFIIHMFQE